MLEKERMIDAEIKQEIEKYCNKQQKRLTSQAAGTAASLQALGVYGVDEVINAGDNLHGQYASSDGDGNDNDDSPRANNGDKED